MKARSRNDHAEQRAVQPSGKSRVSARVVAVLLFAGMLPSGFSAGGGKGGEADFAGIVAGAVVEKMVTDFKAADGPASSRLGYLLFTDAPNDRIWKYIPVGSNDVFEGGASASEPGLVVWREPSHGAVGLTRDRQGRLLACEAGARRVTRTEKDGAITVLADQYLGHRLNGPDDLVHAIDGTTYFTDPRAGGNPAAERSEPSHASVYQIMRNGELRAVATDFSHPGGVALSPDHRTLYVSDAARQHIRAFAIKGDGTLEDGRVFASLRTDGSGVAGGLKTDVKGNVFCAGPGGVWIFDRDGRHLGTIPVPEVATNIGWGDNFDMLYITAQTSLYRIRLKTSGARTY